MTLLYRVTITRTKKKKGKAKSIKQRIMIPVEIVEGSINEAGDFGRKDCKIRPIGGRGKATANYYKLILVNDESLIVKK